MQAQDKDLAGQWALITGASSGFGADFAHLLAERGASLVLVARRGAPMKALAATLKRAHGTETLVIAKDLCRPGCAGALRDRLDLRGIAIDILINNAGCGIAGDFIEQPLDKTLAMLQLNILALTELAHVFGADMAERGGGQILLVGSLGGFAPLPTYAAYAASKAYVLSFGEALHQELKAQGITVTVLCPGATATAFFAAAGHPEPPVPKALMMQSRPVARIGLEAMKAGRAAVVPGFSNRATALSTRLLPRGLFPRLAYRLLKR